jgi:hypothetical protein
VAMKSRVVTPSKRPLTRGGTFSALGDIAFGAGKVPPPRIPRRGKGRGRDVLPTAAVSGGSDLLDGGDPDPHPSMPDAPETPRATRPRP